MSLVITPPPHHTTDLPSPLPGAPTVTGKATPSLSCPGSLFPQGPNSRLSAALGGWAVAALSLSCDVWAAIWVRGKRH